MISIQIFFHLDLIRIYIWIFLDSALDFDLNIVCIRSWFRFETFFFFLHLIGI